MKYIPNKKYISIVLISILLLSGLPFLFELGSEFSTAKAEADLELECTETIEDVKPNLSGDKASVKYEVKIWNMGSESDWFKIEAIKLNILIFTQKLNGRIIKIIFWIHRYKGGAL